MKKIILTFSELAYERNMNFKVIIFPSTTGYLFRENNGVNPTQSLSDMLGDANIDFIDLAPEISAVLGDREYCDLLTNRSRRCSGHYNTDGNQLVAQLVANWLHPKETSPQLFSKFE